MNAQLLEIGLLTAGAGQLAIAILNLWLVQLLKWEQDVAAMSVLVREVFQVHKIFITITVGLFGVWTLLFAGEMAYEPTRMAKALAAGIGLFWGIRTLLQVTYYSASHWKGKPKETAVHFTLLLVYGGMACTYGLVVWGWQ